MDRPPDRESSVIVLNSSLEPQDKKRSSNVPVLLILCCYLLFRVPIASEYFNYHSDEAFYTDNALEMMNRKDYITPYHADGTRRFDKPPITCWFVMLGFELFGITVLASRVFFLLIGVLIVWITYRFALKLLEDPFEHRNVEAPALLAAVILITNVTFLYHTGFAITDGLLTLGMLISYAGFADILLRNRRNNYSLACAYLGTGLAFATKGLPGFLPIPVAFLIGAWQNSRNVERRGKWFPTELLSVPWMAAGAVLGASWMVYEWYLYRDEFWYGFMYDQAFRRFDNVQCLTNLFFYPTNILQVFLPWTLPLVLLLTRLRPALIVHIKKRKTIYAYVLGACFIEYIFYSPVNINRSRYMMPIYPLFSILLADYLAAAARLVRLERFWTRVAYCLSGAGLIAGGVLIFITRHLQERALVAGLLFCTGALALAIRARSKNRTATLAIGIFILFAYSVLDYFEAPLYAPSPAADIVQRLEENGLTNARIELGPEIMYELPSQLRVMTHGQLNYTKLSLSKDASTRPPVLLLKETAIPPATDLSGYKIVPAGYGYFRAEDKGKVGLAKMGLAKMGRAVDELIFAIFTLSGDHDSYVSIYRRRYMLAIRMTP